MPALAAADVAAPRTECALKMLTSMPELASIALSHLATVDDETTLYGLIIAINSCDSEGDLRLAVRRSYSSSARTGHNFGFCVNLGKKNSLIGFFSLDCLASFIG